MRLLVVTPTLGTSPWLGETVLSVAACAPGVIHVLVAPTATVPKLSLEYPGLRVIPEPGGGMYAAINAGLKSSHEWSVGTYLNDDDRLVPEGSRRALGTMASEPSLAAVYGRVAMITDDGNHLVDIPVAGRSADLGPLLAGGVVPLAQPGTWFRRDLFETLGGFEPSWKAAGDMEFFMRAWREHFPFRHINRCVAEFRVHPGQISRNINLIAEEKRRLVEAARSTLDWSARAQRACWRFRLTNLGVYWRRVRRHGFASMDVLGRMDRS